MVQSLDRRIEGVVRAFQDAGRWENTTMILTSDHGQAFGEHDALFHILGVDEPEVRVPLMVRYAHRRHAGATAVGWASLIDVYATLLGEAGVPMPQRPSRPVSLEELVDAPRSEPVYAMSDGLVHASDASQASSARRSAIDRLLVAGYDGEFKVVHDPVSGDLRAFHAANDPDEAHDVAASHGPELAPLAEGVRESAAGSSPGPRRSFPPTWRSRLRSWGYTQDPPMATPPPVPPSPPAPRPAEPFSALRSWTRRLEDRLFPPASGPTSEPSGLLSSDLREWPGIAPRSPIGLVAAGLLERAMAAFPIPAGGDPGQWTSTSYAYVGLPYPTCDRPWAVPTAPVPPARRPRPPRGGADRGAKAYVAVVAVLIGLSTYFLARSLTRRRSTALIAEAIVLLNPTFLQMFFWGFYPNLLGLVFLNLTLAFFVRVHSVPPSHARRPVLDVRPPRRSSPTASSVSS